MNKKQLLQKNLLGFGCILVALLMIGTTGCSGRPTARDVKKYVDNVSAKDGEYKVTRVKIINAVEGSVFGARTYTVQFKFDAVYLKSTPRQLLEAAHKKGEVVHASDGMVMFTKTEKGWTGEDGEIYGGLPIFSTVLLILAGAIVVAGVMKIAPRFAESLPIAAACCGNLSAKMGKMGVDKVSRAVKRQYYAVTAPPSVGSELLTNESIIRLIECGLGESAVIEKIKMSRCAFSLTTGDITDLKSHRVSDALIVHMLKAQSARGLDASYCPENGKQRDQSHIRKTPSEGDVAHVEPDKSRPSPSHAEEKTTVADCDQSGSSILHGPDPQTGRFVIK